MDAASDRSSRKPAFEVKTDRQTAMKRLPSVELRRASAAENLSPRTSTGWGVMPVCWHGKDVELTSVPCSITQREGNYESGMIWMPAVQRYHLGWLWGG